VTKSSIGLPPLEMDSIRLVEQSDWPGCWTTKLQVRCAHQVWMQLGLLAPMMLLTQMAPKIPMFSTSVVAISVQ